MLQVEKPRPAKGSGICPFHQKDQSQVCHKCPLWVQVRGANPQTGEQFDHWDCSFAWMPVLTIENSKLQRETGAAVESFRNAMVQLNAATLERVGEFAKNNRAIPSSVAA